MSNEKIVKTLTNSIRALTWLVAFLIVVVAFLIFCLNTSILKSAGEKNTAQQNDTTSKYLNAIIPPDTMWHPPSENTIPENAEGDLIRYGKDLIARTSFYFGPHGIISAITNGMNCQNCHLDAGTKVFGNNYSAVASTYPKMRARSGMIESIEKRVSDCFERSLNGTAPANDSKEMKAIVAYIKWLGTNVGKGKTPPGALILNLAYLNRAADPEKGKSVYVSKCQSCHGENGEGKIADDKKTYTYPPLWGDHSYNIGAGIFRLSRFAGYVKANMPFGATYQSPQLTDEECWDVAAFVNSQPRPQKDLSRDWPDISKKPIDNPFGPYADGFSEEQHKFGPYAQMKKGK